MFFVGFLMTYIINGAWTTAISILFGALCTPIYAVDVVRQLQEMGTHTKHISTLIEGEMLVGAEVTLVVWALCIGNYIKVLVKWYHFVMVALRYILPRK